MRLHDLFQRSAGEIESLRLCIADIELESVVELAEVFFVPCLAKVSAAITGNHFETFALLMQILELAGLGGGSEGIAATTGENAVHGDESGGSNPHASLNRVEGLSCLFKALATPSNVAALRVKHRYHERRMPGGVDLKSVVVATSDDSIACIADVLQLFIDRFAFLLKVSVALEEGIALDRRGVTITSGAGMSDYFGVDANESVRSSNILSLRARHVSAVLEEALCFSQSSHTSKVQSSHPGLIAPAMLMQSLTVFLRVAVLPLCLCSVPKAGDEQSEDNRKARGQRESDTRHLSTVKDLMGRHAMPLLVNLIEICQSLSRGDAANGFLKVCGDAQVSCWQVQSALGSGGNTRMQQGLAPKRETGGRCDNGSLLSSSHSPLLSILSAARESASGVILLLRGSKENKKRMFSMVDGRTHFVETTESTDAIPEVDIFIFKNAADLEKEEQSKLLLICSEQKRTREQYLREQRIAFLDYQKDAATLLGRLLLPHPPIDSLAEALDIECKDNVLSSIIRESKRSASRATSRAASGARDTGARMVSPLPIDALPTFFVPPMVTSCIDSYLQLQICEIVLRLRMFNVDAFQRLVMYRRFDVSKTADALLSVWGATVSRVMAKQIGTSRKAKEVNTANLCDERLTTKVTTSRSRLSLTDPDDDATKSIATHTTAPTAEATEGQNSECSSSSLKKLLREHLSDPLGDGSEWACAALSDRGSSCFSGSLVYYEQFDALLSQLPVSDADSLFSRMRDMLRDLNEFAVSPLGCEAIAAVVPPIPLRQVRIVSEYEQVCAGKYVSDKRNREGRRQGGDHESVSNVPLSVFLAKRFENWPVRESYWTRRDAPLHRNAISTFEILRAEACFTTSHEDRQSPLPGHASSEPFPLFGGSSTSVHFSPSFMTIEVPPADGTDEIEGSFSGETITIPYDSVRSVRLSRDRTLFVFRLDGGLLLWRENEKRRLRDQERARAEGVRRRGARLADEDGDEVEDLPSDHNNSFVSGAFDEDYSHVFNIAGDSDDCKEAQWKEESGDAQIFGNQHEECSRSVINLFGSRLGRIPKLLQQLVVSGAAGSCESLSSLRRMLSTSILPSGTPPRLPDVTLHFVITKSTVAGIINAGVHKRIERMRSSYGLALGLARGVGTVVQARVPAAPLQQPAMESSRDPLGGAGTQHNSIIAPPIVLEVKAQDKMPEGQPPRQPVESLRVDSDALPSLSDAQTELTRRASIARATSSSQNAVDTHGTRYNEQTRGHVLHMVSDVLNEQSCARQRQRRLAILEAHSAQIQAYVDAYRSESRALEENYLADVNADLSSLKLKQREFSNAVRTAVDELNEGVEILRTVESTLKTKLASVEEAYQSSAYTREVKAAEMAALVDIKRIVDSSVNSMEDFLRENITGSNPLQILEDFVAMRSIK